MSYAYHPLNYTPLRRGCVLLQPQQARNAISLETPALTLMTDFSQRQAMTIPAQRSLDEAQAQMESAHVRLLLVTDSQGELRGLISAADLLGRKPLAYAQQMGVKRHEITVENLMTSLSELHALPLQAVNKARVGDLLSTLKREGDQHMLVVDEIEGEQVVCGLFSAADFARALKVPFNIAAPARSFADLERALYRQEEIN